MIYDCIVIGGGPAGLNASLMLGRSRRQTILFDNSQPRNAVTYESHGFITRDGTTPTQFREIAYHELASYPNLEVRKQTVTNVIKNTDDFSIQTEDGLTFNTKKVILATGYQDILPDIPNIADYYGSSLFSCPFCDGWELKDQPLVVIAENNRAFHFAQVVYNWSTDLIVCTNGQIALTTTEKKILDNKRITFYEQPILRLTGKNGQLDSIIFADQTTVMRSGGFIATDWKHTTNFAQELGCELNQQGGIKTDELGQTNVPGVFACGDVSIINPSQVVIAAAAGSKAAIAVNTELFKEIF